MNRNTLRLRLAAAALALAGFAGPALAQETVLKMVSWQKDEKGVGDWFNALIAQFEKAHPGVKIEFAKIEAANYAPTLNTLFAQRLAAAGHRPRRRLRLSAFRRQQLARESRSVHREIEARSQGLVGAGAMQVEGGDRLYRQPLLRLHPRLQRRTSAESGRRGSEDAEFLAAAKKLTVDTNGDGIIDQYGTGHEIGDGVSWYVTEMLNYMLPRGAF